MYRKTVMLLVTAGVAAGATQSALAETTNQDAFDYRIAIMTTLKGHLVASSMVLRGLVDDNGHLGDHARSLANSVAELEYVFPEGSDVEDSKALAAVWQDADEFAAAVEKAKAATTEFAKAAASGDMEASGAAFRQVGGACRGCHDNFKLQED